MGWTSLVATEFKNGKIDRKAQCTYELEKYGDCSVLKCSMVGNVYYCALKHNKTNTVWGVVVLTSVNNRDVYNFAYKDIDETMGPYECDCPISILNLLTPTDNEWANNWRNKCRENFAKKKTKNVLNNLPVGSKIKFVLPFDTTYNTKGSTIVLEKKLLRGLDKPCWCDNMCRWTQPLIKKINDSGNFEVIEIGE